MTKIDFDNFAENYASMHKKNIKISGEDSSYFSEYKVRDLANYLRGNLSKKIRILDFGSGIGNSIPWFIKYLPNAKITCLDISQKSLDIAKRQYKSNVEFVRFDFAEKIPFEKNSFEIIFVSCVFHHIPQSNYKSLLLEMHRVLVHGGCLFIFEHNPINPLTVYAVKTCPFDKDAKLINGKKMKDFIRKAGFQSCTIKYRVFFPKFASAFRPLENYLTWLPLGAQYYLVGHKK